MTILLIAAGTSYASPFFSIDTLGEWDTAIGTTINPVTSAEWSVMVGNNTGLDDEFVGTYSEPLLAAAQDAAYDYDGETTSEAGLVMGWGEADNTSYTAAWEYVYPADPNLIGQTLNVGLLAPQWTSSTTLMNSIGLGLVDVGGAIRSWTWNTAATANAGTNTIAWNQVWNVSSGPIVGMIPPGPAGGGPASATRGATVIPPIFFNNTAFDPAFVVSIIGIENGVTASSAPVPPGGLPAMPIWNWWQNLSVVPEPCSLALLLPLCGALLLRRRR